MKKFREMSNIQKAIITILGIVFIPITLILLSARGLINSIKSKQIIKAIISGVCVLVTVSFAIGIYGDIEPIEKPQTEIVSTDKTSKDKEETKAETETKEEVKEEVKEEEKNKSNDKETAETKEEVEVEVSKEDQMKEVAKSVLKDELLDFTLNEDNGAVVIKAELSDNFTNNFIIKGGYMEAEKIVKSLNEKFDNIETYDFWFVMNLVDKYGNESQDKVLSFDYDDNDIDKINWENMYTDRFMELAKNEWIHPALR